MARTRDEHAHASTCANDEEKKRVENPNAPMIEKRREAIVQVSRKLKILLAIDDSTVMHKSD
jgi:DNA repair photolyase